MKNLYAPKPTTNLLKRDATRQMLTPKKLRKVLKSGHYRKELEPLIGGFVKIEASDFQFHKDVVGLRLCLSLMLKDAYVVQGPKPKKNKYPIYIDHIWTVVDPSWLDRNELPQGCKMHIYGTLYMYKSRGEKNIGLETISIHPVIENGIQTC